LNTMTVSNTDSPSEISIIQLGQWFTHACLLRYLNCAAADTTKVFTMKRKLRWLRK
jgi:hypothetical protein